MELSQPSAPDDSATGADQAAAAQPNDAAELRRQLAQAKEREAEARRALGLLDTILNQLPVGVKVQVRDGAVLFINDTEARFGRASEGRADAAPPQALVPATAAPLGVDTETAPVFTTEDHISGPDGERVFLRCCKQAHIHGQDVVLSASIDFTERKQGEIELSKRAYFDDL